MSMNYYEILGVSEDATTEEIKEVYKKLCLIYHPDKNKSKAASEKFIQIQRAYEVLTDSTSRKAYDREQIPEPIKIGLSLTLAEMMHGCSKSIEIRRNVVENLAIVKRYKKFDFDIKPGIKAGTKYTFHGEGHRLPGKKHGDVIFIIEEEKHPTFVRDGNNIRYRKFICYRSVSPGMDIFLPSISVLGFDMKFPLHPEMLKSKEKRFPGLGFPHSKEPEKRGDLIIEFEIDYLNTVTYDQYRKNCFCNGTGSYYY